MSAGTKVPILESLRRVRPLIKALATRARTEIAGSARRRLHFVRDIDLVIHGQPDDVIDLLEDLPIHLHGGRKIRLTYDGIPVDLLFTEPEQAGAALLYLTGSAKFNIKMRAKAKASGYKLNEYGLWHEERRIAGQTEREIFTKLGMEFIPPKDREV